MTTNENAREEDSDALLIGARSREIVREAVTSMPRLFISAIVAYGTLSYVAKVLLLASNEVATIDGHYRLSNEWLNLVGLFILGVIQSVILSSVAIAVHRLILCDETKKGVITPFNRRGLTFTLWIMALRFPLFIVAGFGAGVLRSHSGVFLVLGLLFCSAFYVGVRTSLIFPAIAIDIHYDGVSSRITAAWYMSRQRFWRLFASTFWAVLPLTIVVILVGLVLAFVMSLIIPGSESQSSFPFWSQWINPLTNAISSVLIVALGAAALSWNYRIVRASPRPSTSSG